MATTPSDNPQWNIDETMALVDFLLEHKSEIGDAGMYKRGTFNAAAGHIAEHHTLGPVKTGKMCKTKWRAIKTNIQKHRETSGFHRDNTTGATIGTPAEENSRNEYEKVKSNVDYEASGSTKIDDDMEIDGGERTYPPPRKFMMRTDTAQTPTLSVSSGKRKYSAHHDTSSISLLSSEPTATSDATTSEPAGKKRSTGKDKQPTMNRVTDPQSATRSDALHFLQTREDDLSLDDKTKVVRLFMKDNIAAETYIALVNDDLRRNWLATMLAEE